MIIIIILFALAVIGLLFLLLRYKRLRYGNLTLVTGGVKTGKTQLCVALAVKQYRKAYKKWRKATKKAQRRFEPLPEQPLLYSNVPIGKKGMSYAPLTAELLTGKERFRYGSVIYINEVSLVSGCMDFKDDNVNDRLNELYKLIAHRTKGGYMFLDTQSPMDMHYTIKRSLSTYYTIQRRLTLPFISVLWIRENILVDGAETVAIDTNQDPQDSTSEGGKPYYIRLILNKWWKYYDQYAYSVLTDSLPVGAETKVVVSQKCGVLLRLKELFGGKRR